MPSDQNKLADQSSESMRQVNIEMQQALSEVQDGLPNITKRPGEWPGSTDEDLTGDTRMPASDQPDLDAAVQACRKVIADYPAYYRDALEVVLAELDRLRQPAPDDALDARARERVAALEAALGTEQAMHRAWRKRAEEAEDRRPPHPFHGIEGLKPVDRADLAEYEAAMKEAIPEMIEEVRKREQLAHESRQRFMG